MILAKTNNILSKEILKKEWPASDFAYKGEKETHLLTTATVSITQFIIRKTPIAIKQLFGPENALLLSGLKVHLWWVRGSWA